MFEEKVKLNKQRDFSDVLNASFKFIKQEYKTLLKILLIYAGIPVLILAILSTLYVENPFANIIKIFENPSSAQTINNGMQVKSFLTNLIKVIVNVFLTGITYCYIVIYIKNETEDINIKEVWNKFTTIFSALLGYNILTGIIVIISFIALIIPGLYVLVPLSFILIIKINENNNFSNSFERCFFLVKNHWWESFGLILIAGFITIMLSSIFNIPASSFQLVKSLLSLDPASETVIFVLSSFISTIGTALITPLSAIIISFQYFSLVEHKDNTSLLNKIDQINK